MNNENSKAPHIACDGNPAVTSVVSVRISNAENIYVTTSSWVNETQPVK